MIIPDWIWFIFIFAVGCCIGSFLNVVIYRVPRDLSVVFNGSSCTSCQSKIRFYDNIPLFSWLILGGKCRYCKKPISPRYIIVEFFTGIVFIALYYLYFKTNIITSMIPFESGGWLIYLAHIAMLSSLIAASVIDMQLWIIPISICWFMTLVGFAASALAGYAIEPELIVRNFLMPTASVNTATLSAGAAVGTIISMILLTTGLIKRSYDEQCNQESDLPDSEDTSNINHRIEVCKEILFLLPIIICSIFSFLIAKHVPSVRSWWANILQFYLVSGFLGSLWGYCIGCAIVWMTRIFGTIAFGKEAMGLGDVHLMGAAGAIIGPVLVVVAFFVAPFLGLAWAVVQMFFKKTRQIPYGPFLSMGIITVMILHDRIILYFVSFFYR